MSDNEEWRRELAERLHPNTDWTVRPMPRRAAPPVAPMTPTQEVNVAPLAGVAPTESAAAVAADPAPTMLSRPAPMVAEASPVPEARVWPYVLAALAMLAAAAGWLFANRVGESPGAPAAAQVAARPVSVAASVSLASLPADGAARCEATLAAPVLAALFRRGTAFDGQGAPATLGAVQLLAADGSTAVCHGVIELQLADARAGSPVMQIVSGPVDYAVDGGPGASVPTFRVLRARSILQRLATMPAAVPVAVASAEPAAVAVAEPAAVVPVPDPVERAKPVRVVPAATPETVARLSVPSPAAQPLPSRRAATETAALPATAETLSPRRTEEKAAPAAATETGAALDAGGPDDERAADSAAAQAIYVAIARSGDPQAIDAADEGRDLYLRHSRRCTTASCASVAYKRWLTQLRDIDERSRGYVNR
nr:hypothetical protein [Polymorphobacter sp.]